MNIAIIALLAALVSLDLFRWFQGKRLDSKKAHFKNKLLGTYRLIWDLEFKVFKTKEIREGIRQEYDNMSSRIASLEDQIKNWPSDKDQGEKARLEDQKVIAARDRDRFQHQMASLDAEVHGLKPSNENPNGMVGILEQIDSLRELAGMLKDHIKTL